MDLVAFTCYVDLVEDGYGPSISARRVAQYDRVPNQTKLSVHFLHLKLKNAQCNGYFVLDCTDKIITSLL